MSSSEYETVDILICGCGPTGAMLSGYLGRMGVQNVVLEKEPAITTDPRGITLDDDGIRYLQGLGLYEHIFSDMGSCISRIRFVGGVHRDLQRAPFLSLDTGSTEGHTGHVGVIGHKQPVLEKHLRSVLERSEFCDLRSSCTLTSINEDESWVYVTYTDANGDEKRIRSKFLVAADGKTGFTRKKYLEPKGVRLEWAEETKYDETWVALNWKINLPTKESHPNFPLWKLGYTPEQVYDLFFPSDFRFLCNAQRPAVCGRFGLPEDRLWRFEFVIAAGEDGNEMAQRHKIREVVTPYITHPGRLYGLKEDVEFPEDCIEVLRSRPFGFSARSCNKWALGRVILCGDAAHVFPPFGGQGIASGFRDAIGLAWRLAILCFSSSLTSLPSPNKESPQPDHHSIIKAWYTERKQQLEKSLAATVRNGSLVNTRGSIQGFLRNWILWGVQLVPRWKRLLERGTRNDAQAQYAHVPGMPFLPEFHGGILFAQTYCTSLLAENTAIQFTDDVIFSAEKRGLFQVVVLIRSLDELRPALGELGTIQSVGISDRLLSVDEAAIFVPRQSLSEKNKTLNQEVDALVAFDHGLPRRVFRTADADEFARSPLCRGRPEPRRYNETLMWEGEVGKKQFVILRPDRFVFAACDGEVELRKAAERLAEMFA